MGIATRLTLVAALTLGMAALLPTGHAQAHEGEPIVFEAETGTSVTREFDTPLIADGALTNAPGDCAVSPACVEYALDVLPGANDADWVLDIEADWSAEDIETGLAGGADSADVDLFVFIEDPQDGWIVLNSSTTQGGRPERVKLFSPGTGQYAITVAVFAGATDLTRLTLEATDASFEPPPPLPDDPVQARPVPPTDVGSEVEPAPAPPPALAAPMPRRSLAVGEPERRPTAVSTPEVSGFGPSAAADPDFGSRFGTLDARLGGEARESLSLAASRHPDTIERVSAATVLWLGVAAPMAALAGLATWVVRLRPTAVRHQRSLTNRTRHG